MSPFADALGHLAARCFVLGCVAEPAHRIIADVIRSLEGFLLAQCSEPSRETLASCRRRRVFDYSMLHYEFSVAIARDRALSQRLLIGLLDAILMHGGAPLSRSVNYNAIGILKAMVAYYFARWPSPGLKLHNATIGGNVSIEAPDDHLARLGLTSSIEVFGLNANRLHVRPGRGWAGEVNIHEGQIDRLVIGPVDHDVAQIEFTGFPGPVRISGVTSIG